MREKFETNASSEQRLRLFLSALLALWLSLALAYSFVRSRHSFAYSIANVIKSQNSNRSGSSFFQFSRFLLNFVATDEEREREKATAWTRKSADNRIFRKHFVCHLYLLRFGFQPSKSVIRQRSSRTDRHFNLSKSCARAYSIAVFVMFHFARMNRICRWVICKYTLHIIYHPFNVLVFV